MFVLSEVRQVVRLMPRSFKESLRDQVLGKAFLLCE